MDDDYEGEAPRSAKPIRINAADFAISFVMFLRGVAEGVAGGLAYLESSLACHTKAIGERQEFERTVGRQIESFRNVGDIDG